MRDCTDRLIFLYSLLRFKVYRKKTETLGKKLYFGRITACAARRDGNLPDVWVPWVGGRVRGGARGSRAPGATTFGWVI